MIADSSALVGAKPVDSISVCCESIQLSLAAISAPALFRNSRVGSARASGTPKSPSEVPIARIITFFGADPVMMKPPMSRLSSVPALTRVEIFASVSAAVRERGGPMSGSAPSGSRGNLAYGRRAPR